MKKVIKNIVSGIFKISGFKIVKIDNPAQVASEPAKDRFRNCYSDPGQKIDLLIIDDFLPNLMGSWRSIEISSYLKSFGNAKLLCTLDLYLNYKILDNINFERDKEEFINFYGLNLESHNIDNIESNKINVNAKLGYCLFYNNLKFSFPLFEKFKVPFLFTLYPGGGFKFYDNEIEDFLKKINQSSLFKGVIVTQQSVYDYLIARNLIDKNKISLIWGVPYQLESFKATGTKKYYNVDKQSLDICFVAGKYSPFGIDKGFDVFCQVAKVLAEKYKFINFHIVGGFNASDLLYDLDESRIKFYGYQYFDFFKAFYCDIDIIVSPVKSHILGTGSFDGFPTASVLDAGLFDVLMITSDPLGDNIVPKFKNGDELYLTESNKYSIISIIEKLIENPDQIQSIALKGKKKLIDLLAFKNQIEPRIQLLKTNLG